MCAQMMLAEDDSLCSDSSDGVLRVSTTDFLSESDSESSKEFSPPPPSPPPPPANFDHNASTDTKNNNNNDLARTSDVTHVIQSEEEPKDEERAPPETFFQHVGAAFEMLHTVRHIAGRFVNSNGVQLLIVILIGINAIMMGIETYKAIRDKERASTVFETIEKIFLIIFTVELGLQFFYHGWRFFLDGWLIFDFTIITITWFFSEVQIIRAFRIFRALRLVTRVKVMKNLILALFSVIPRIFSIGMLLSLVSYIFAVMFTELFKNLYEEGATDYNYFGVLFDSFFTLFQLMSLDNWGDVARQVMDVYSWAWFPIMTYVIISGFVVVNLIIAVICDAVSALEDDQRAKLLGMYHEEATLNDESQHPALQEDVREQLDVLETYVEELSNMQEQTLRTLQILTKQLEEFRRIKCDSNGAIQLNDMDIEPRGGQRPGFSKLD